MIRMHLWKQPGAISPKQQPNDVKRILFLTHSFSVCRRFENTCSVIPSASTTAYMSSQNSPFWTFKEFNWHMPNWCTASRSVAKYFCECKACESRQQFGHFQFQLYKLQGGCAWLVLVLWWPTISATRVLSSLNWPHSMRSELNLPKSVLILHLPSVYHHPLCHPYGGSCSHDSNDPIEFYCRACHISERISH